MSREMELGKELQQALKDHEEAKDAMIRALVEGDAKEEDRQRKEAEKSWKRVEKAREALWKNFDRHR